MTDPPGVSSNEVPAPGFGELRAVLLDEALLVVDVGIAAALSVGLAIIVAVAVAAHVVSRTSTSWSAPR
jgi:hypothetical protein